MRKGFGNQARRVLILTALALTGCPQLAKHTFVSPQIRPAATMLPPGDYGRSLDVSFSPDGRWALAQQIEGQVTFWQLTGAKDRVTEPALALVGKGWRRAAFSADCTRGITCEGHEPSFSARQAGERTTQTLKVWKVRLEETADIELCAQESIETETPHCGAPLLTPDGEWAVTFEGSYVRGRENVLRLWHVTGAVDVAIRLVDTVRHDVEAIAGGILLGGGGRYVLSRTQAGEYRLFHINRVESRLTELGMMQHGRDGFAQAVGFSPDGRWALTSAFEDLELWKLSPEAAPERVARVGPEPKESWASGSIVFHPSSRWAISGGISLASLWRIDGESANPLVLSDRLTGHGGYIRCVVLSRDGSLALTGAQDAVGALWSLDGERGRCEAESVLAGHDHYVICAAFSPDGRHALTGSNDGTVRLWRLSPAQGH